MRARHFFTRLHILVLLGVAMMHAHAATPEYRVTVLAPPGSSASAINQAGVVVGSYVARSGAAGAFLNRGKGMVPLGRIGVSSGPAAINDKGQVLGNWVTDGGQRRGVIWYRGHTRDIGIVPGTPGGYHTAINNAGYSVVQAPVDGITRSYLRAPDGSYRDIGNLPAMPPTTNAEGLNNRNQITGGSGEFSLPEIQFRAFTWTRGTMRDLGDIGSMPNVGNDINDRGQVTGFASLPAAFPDRLAFIHTRGRLQVIDGRPASVSPYSEGWRINNRGHVIGFSDHLFGFVYRGRRMEALNALVDPAAGWSLTPNDINDAGQIAATGYRGGQQFAVRLDLIRPAIEAAPEPDTEADADASQPDFLLTPAQAAEEARLDAEAEAREAVQPMQ